MTNRLAFTLLFVILAGIAVDTVVYNAAHLSTLLDRYDQFIEYLAFWR